MARADIGGDGVSYTRKDAHLFVGQNLSWDDVRDGATEWANQARTRLDAARAGQR
jgi:hypothetical protein